MDTSPIGFNPQITPVSAPTGPSPSAGSQRRSIDSTQARPWQTSVPLMAPSAPTALDLSALRDLTKHLAETDEGFATPMVLFAAKIEESSNQKLLQNFSAYRQELFTLLTPEALRANPEYLAAYRKFLGRYRDCSLCSSVTLKNSQGNEAKIDKLLICTASSVIENAFETGWAECKIGIYLSDELNEDFFIYVVGFIKTGTFQGEPEPDRLLECIIARYTTALALDLQAVVRYCQSVLSGWPQPMRLDKIAFYALWRLGEKYKEGFLKSFCLGYILTSQSETILQSCPEELQKLQDDFARVRPCLVLHPFEVEITTLNEEVMQFCQELDLKEVKISCNLGSDLKVIESLKQFKKITLGEDGVKGTSISQLLVCNACLTELICLTDVRVNMFADAIAENQSLKIFTCRTLKIASEKELNVLGASLQKNLTLFLLNGVTQADAMWLRNALIEGPFERPVVLRFSSL